MVGLQVLDLNILVRIRSRSFERVVVVWRGEVGLQVLDLNILVRIQAPEHGKYPRFYSLKLV